MSECGHELVFHQWITLPFSGVTPIFKCSKCERFEFTGAEERDLALMGHRELIINLDKKRRKK